MRAERGFTLIEVLIAATVLFAAIAVISETYRASMLASRRAENVAAMLAPLPLIVAAIRSALREDPAERREGEAEMLGVRYRFDATTARFEPPAPRVDPDSGDLRQYPPRFRLYDVRLELSYREQERTYLYQELAWLPLEG
jgi:prepilin-type N-terminal cleavage/methylation domain-containing protein